MLKKQFQNNLASKLLIKKSLTLSFSSLFQQVTQLRLKGRLLLVLFETEFKDPDFEPVFHQNEQR